MDSFIDAKGHLDLSSCSTGMHYDMFKVMNLSHQYYFSHLQNLVAWDGLPIIGMDSEKKWHHLICKHGKDKSSINPIIDIDLDRVMRLPVIKRVVTGQLDIDIYKQVNRKGNVDKVQVVVSGIEQDYLVSLGFFGDHYVLRSAYHAGSRYIHGKVIPSGELICQLRN